MIRKAFGPFLFIALYPFVACLPADIELKT
jgi:hypothetical protein